MLNAVSYTTMVIGLIVTLSHLQDTNK